MFSSTQLLIGGIILLVIGYFIIYGSSLMSIKEGFGNCMNLGHGALKWRAGPGIVPYTGEGDGWVNGECPYSSCWNPLGISAPGRTDNEPTQTCMLPKSAPYGAPTGPENTYSCSNLPGTGWINGALGMASSMGQYTGVGDGWAAGQIYPCPPSSCFNPSGYNGLYDGKVIHTNWKCMLPTKPPIPVCTSSICNAQTQIFTGTNVTCNGPTCTPEECCENRAQCSSLKPKKLPTPGPAWSPGSDDGCDLSKYDAKPSDTYCDGVTCSVSECCTPDPTCAGYDCPVDTYHPKPNLAGIRCGINQVCTTDDCCIINPTCSGFSSCPIHEHLKDNAGAIRCTSATCNSTECCGWNPKCSTHACPQNTYYNLFTHIPNASSVFCDTQTCTDDQCCIVTPTGNLPKVQTYPLFSQ